MHLLHAALPGLLFFLAVTSANPTISLFKDLDFADPTIVQDPQTGDWYAFATTANGVNVQVASAQNSTGPWTYLNGTDALPKPGAWVHAANPQIWAPDVRWLPNATYVIYYSGLSDENTAHHCIGVAYSANITGPFIAQDDVWECPLDQGGAIDANGMFDEATSTRWVVYKVDGSSLCSGGSCGNDPPKCPTPIMLQQVSTADGMTKIGNATQILDRDDSDGPLVEAPDLVRVNDTYVLFFSSHCYNSPDYNIKYATAQNVTGPYTRGPAEVLGASTKDLWNLTSPGGATSVQDGGRMVFHVNCGANRCMWEAPWTLYWNWTVTVT